MTPESGTFVWVDSKLFGRNRSSGESSPYIALVTGADDAHLYVVIFAPLRNGAPATMPLREHETNEVTGWYWSKERPT